MKKKRNSITDLKGASRLAKEGVAGIIDMVEVIHCNILSLGGRLGSSKNKRTSGITGMVYRNIRSITNISSDGIDLVLEKLSERVQEREPSSKQEAFLSILNGVLGDTLEKKGNPLAINIQLRQHGKPLISANHLCTGNIQKVVILIHGSCMNDLQWNRNDHNHGTELSKDLGISPVYLLYNSGRHISDNGKALNKLLEEFMKNASGKIELNILAHSMGGLVARSAVHYAQNGNSSWHKQLNKIIFLGTPHHGAPLEKIGNLIDNGLEMNKFSAPISKLGKIRSAGITDLRYGNILEEDWMQQDRFEPVGDTRTPVPLPAEIQCYTIAATYREKPSKFGDGLIGDGLVPMRSALGLHKNVEHTLLFPGGHQWIGRSLKHLDLLDDQNVYNTIKRWVQQ